MSTHKVQKKSQNMVYKLNCPDDDYIANVKHSIQLQLPQAWPKQEQDITIGIVGGGPSLKESIEDIKQKHSEGMKFVSLNGTHDYLVDNGVRPSAHVQIDGREFNARFVKNWQEKTKYLIASQCHPKVFENLKDAEVYLFHCVSNIVDKKIYDDYYMGNYVIIPGGSTVMLRAIPLMRMLGFKRMELFGFDSCVMESEHHSYKQVENDMGPATEIEVGGRKFIVYSWMASQANDFIKMVEAIGDKFELIVHGDGLIAHMLKTSSDNIEVK